MVSASPVCPFLGLGLSHRLVGSSSPAPAHLTRRRSWAARMLPHPPAAPRHQRLVSRRFVLCPWPPGLPLGLLRLLASPPRPAALPRLSAPSPVPLLDPVCLGLALLPRPGRPGPLLCSAFCSPELLPRLASARPPRRRSRPSLPCARRGRIGLVGAALLSWPAFAAAAEARSASRSWRPATRAATRARRSSSGGRGAWEEGASTASPGISTLVDASVASSLSPSVGGSSTTTSSLGFGVCFGWTQPRTCGGRGVERRDGLFLRAPPERPRRPPSCSHLLTGLASSRSRSCAALASRLLAAFRPFLSSRSRFRRALASSRWRRAAALASLGSCRSGLAGSRPGSTSGAGRSARPRSAALGAARHVGGRTVRLVGADLGFGLCFGLGDDVSGRRNVTCVERRVFW